MIDVYATWCSHCRQLEPIWANLAKELAPQGIRVGKINGPENKVLMGRFGVSAFPAIFMLRDGATWAYDGGRTATALKEFATKGYKDESALPFWQSPNSAVGMLLGYVHRVPALAKEAYTYLREDRGVSDLAMVVGFLAVPVVVGGATICLVDMVYLRQVLSSKATVPAFGFGSGTRDQYTKVYASKEQERALAGNSSPGPLYTSHAALGKQPESGRESAPSAGFGCGKRGANFNSLSPGPGAYHLESTSGTLHATAPRTPFGSSTRASQSKVWLGEDLMRTTAGSKTPGPNYAKPDSIGKQPDSLHTSSPSFSLGGAGGRFGPPGNGLRKSTPAPGSYDTTTMSRAQQSLSTHASTTMIGMGTSSRNGAGRLYISREHDRCSAGAVSPGPASTGPNSAIGRQPLSPSKNSPSFGFGTSQRSPVGRSSTPGTVGPGSYYA
ncbi:hypothetical protein FOA52_016281 [Chlamydomonas sp. UWO 241]|nr:hypothetical protein FOA52_016281 [Chlamydomonas sp. UWO 241]